MASIRRILRPCWRSEINIIVNRDETETVMAKNDPAKFHKLYGIKKPKVTYYGRDFLDYVSMVLLSPAVVTFSYVVSHAMLIIWFSLCAFTFVMFIISYIIEFIFPVILLRPQAVLCAFLHYLPALTP